MMPVAVIAEERSTGCWEIVIMFNCRFELGCRVTEREMEGQRKLVEYHIKKAGI